jgi:hypothetical protein
MIFKCRLANLILFQACPHSPPTFCRLRYDNSTTNDNCSEKDLKNGHIIGIIYFKPLPPGQQIYHFQVPLLSLNSCRGRRFKKQSSAALLQFDPTDFIRRRCLPSQAVQPGDHQQLSNCKGDWDTINSLSRWTSSRHFQISLIESVKANRVWN